MLLVAGTPAELDGLEAVARRFGISRDSMQVETYESVQETPPDDLQFDVAVVEMSFSTLGWARIATRLKRICPYGTLFCLFRGWPDAEVRRELERQVFDIGATFIVMTEADPRETHRSFAHIKSHLCVS